VIEACVFCFYVGGASEGVGQYDAEQEVNGHRRCCLLLLLWVLDWRPSEC
jgi:hypothetical protein